jgi:N-methylhydantoinase A
MKKEGLSLLKIENVPEKKVEFVYSLDLRYVNQYHEVNVEITERELKTAPKAFGEPIKPKFHKKHNALYGYSLENEGTPIELINMRLVCIGKTEKPRFIEQEFAGKDAKKALKNRRKVFLPREKKFVTVDVYDGFKLRYGNRIKGPAIIEQVNTTTFVTPEFHVLVDKFGSYTLYLKEKEAEIRKRLEV